MATCLFDRKIVWRNEALSGVNGEDLLERELVEYFDDSCRSELDAVFAEAAAHKDGLKLRVRGSLDNAELREWELTPLLPSENLSKQCVFYCVGLADANVSGHDAAVPTRPAMWASLQAIMSELRCLGLTTRVETEDPGSFSDVRGSELLTDREREILSYVATGLKPKDIGVRLYLSSSAVRNHLSSIYRKLGVTNQSELLQLLLHQRP